MEQIQQKGTRDGNAIFAQIAGLRVATAPFCPRRVGFAAEAASIRRGRLGLIREGISRKSASPAAEKDLM
jgi:hypothetical protein